MGGQRGADPVGDGWSSQHTKQHDAVATHRTLVAAVKAAGLVETLKGKGPFTVFAPTNEAFAALPAGTVDNLLKPENKAMLSHILTYHVVAGNLDATAVGQAIKAGNVARVTIADVKQSNGVIPVINKVLMPGM